LSAKIGRINVETFYFVNISTISAFEGSLQNNLLSGFCNINSWSDSY